MTRDATHLFLVPVDRLTQRALLDRLEQFIRDGQQHVVLYANADCLNQAVWDRRYASILREADMVYADGMSVVWASRLFGEPLPQRLTLGDLLPQLCRWCVQYGYRLFFLGGSPGVAEQAARRLQRQFPGLQIVGTHDGFVRPEDDRAVIEQINRAQPHLLLVGMGVPKQEKWLWQHRHQLKAPVLWGVGALFDYSAGKTPRAPMWMRKVGFEWLFRLLVEPKRLWRRYLIGNAFFIVRTCALLLVDAGLVTASWLGAYGLCRWFEQPLGVTLNPVDPYFNAVGLIVGIWLLTCASFGLYRRSATMSALAELAQVIRATWVGLLSTMAVAFLLRGASFGRPVVLLFGVFTFLSLSLSRFVTRAFERRLAKRGIGLRRVLIVGTGTLAKRVKEEIETWPIGYEVVGFVKDGEAVAGVEASEVVGALEELGSLIRSRRVQEVFVASQNLVLHQELNLLARHERWPVNFHVVSNELESIAQRLPMERVVELPLLQLPHARANLWYELTKRLFDGAMAGASLLLCAPLMGVMALTIKMESPGPVLFAQQRVGRRGRLFRMYKFRTMRADAEAYTVAPNDVRDPRVTRFGRFLRRWSLDELPQLLNIVTGDMSVVGPRPEMSFLVEQYQPWQRRRLVVRPGLTGLWQVIGRKELPLHRNLEYDLYYVRHRGWLLDCVILLRTIPTVLSRRGAF